MTEHTNGDDDDGNDGDTDDMARELLGAYAVNAIDDDNERTAVEDLLARDPAAVDELRRHEEVLAALAGNLEPITPPASVWAGTLARISSTPQDQALISTTPPTSATPLRTVTSIARYRRRRAAVGAAVLVAAAVLAVLVWPRADTGVPARDEVAEAFATPGHRVATLIGATAAGQPISVQVVTLPDGSGLVIGSSLPGAGSGNVYQLWAVDGATPLSLGPIGESPTTAKFHVDQPVNTLALSVERAPGAASPTLPPLAVGNLA